MVGVPAVEEAPASSPLQTQGVRTLCLAQLPRVGFEAAAVVAAAAAALAAADGKERLWGGWIGNLRVTTGLGGPDFPCPTHM